MTLEQIKKIDQKVHSLHDPFGIGFFVLYKTYREMAELKGETFEEIVCQYNSWKQKHYV